MATNSSTSTSNPKRVRVHWKASQLVQENVYLKNNTDTPVPGLEKNPAMQPAMAIFERDSPWDRKNILTLDGDGKLGYSSLLILRALMEEVRKAELSENAEASSSTYSPFIDCSAEEDLGHSTNPKSDDDLQEKKPPAYRPCHYFDYIGGSSTGGLIALMLGRMRMSVDDALTTYQKLSVNIANLSLFRLGMSRIGFKNEALTERYETFVKGLHPFFPSPNELRKKFESDYTRCKTIVCSIQSGQDKKHKRPYLFRSYNSSLEIWQVARAATAAPFHFEPITLGDELYYDASAFFQNLARYVLDEVGREAQGRPDAVDILLSIGAGNYGDGKGVARRGSNTWKLQRTQISDPVHENLALETESQLFDYYRLNVDDRLPTGHSDEWKLKSKNTNTHQQIVDACTKYLEAQPVQEQLQKLAKRLISIRLRRAGTMQWERFATGVIYKCPISNCPKSSSRFEDRGYLMDHLRNMHDSPPPMVANNQEIKALLDRGRTNSG